MEQNKKTNYTKIIVRVLLLLCLTSGLLRWLYTLPAVKEAVAMATSVRAEKFTELYFENYSQLPKLVKIGETQNFIFTIHNLENMDKSYIYAVYLLQDGQKVVLDQGVINLKSDEFRFTKEDFTITENVKTEVMVELTNKQRSIHFWIEKI